MERLTFLLLGLLALADLSHSKRWTRCELLKELQRIHHDDQLISQYLCLAEAGLGLNSSLPLPSLGMKDGKPECRYKNYGLFQIGSLGSCKDEDLDPNCKPSQSTCDVDCSDLLNDDLKDDVECISTILKAGKYQEFPNTTFDLCLGGPLEKIDANSTCSQIQIQATQKLGFHGNVAESTVKTHNSTVVCVLNSFSHRRTSPQAKFELDNIDPDLCTHLIYCVSSISNLTYGIVPEDPLLNTDENGPKWYSRIPALKVKHPHLKVILSVGGWAAGVETFQQVGRDGTKRGIFIQSAIQLLKKYNFDGMDILWMWPAVGYRYGADDDKPHLTDLLKDTKKSFDEHGLILTLTMNGEPEIIRKGYDLPQVSKLVDQIHLLAIDYAGSWNEKTGHHSSLHSTEGGKLSVEKLIDFLLGEQVPPEKLVLGIPFFGRTFKLKDEGVKNGLGDFTIKGGFESQFYPDNNAIGYNEICHEMLSKESKWTFFRDDKSKAPFAKNGPKWISFDDPESIWEKVNYGREKELKGFMAWSMDTDDFKGTNCNSGGVNYPLLRSINYFLSNPDQPIKKFNTIMPRSGDTKTGLTDTTKGPKGVSSGGSYKSFQQTVSSIIPLLLLAYNLFA